MVRRGDWPSGLDEMLAFFRRTTAYRLSDVLTLPPEARESDALAELFAGVATKELSAALDFECSLIEWQSDGYIEIHTGTERPDDAGLQGHRHRLFVVFEVGNWPIVQWHSSGFSEGHEGRWTDISRTRNVPAPELDFGDVARVNEVDFQHWLESQI